jgi:hypothetical protein
MRVTVVVGQGRALFAPIIVPMVLPMVLQWCYRWYHRWYCPWYWQERDHVRAEAAAARHQVSAGGQFYVDNAQVVVVLVLVLVVTMTMIKTAQGM